MAVYRGRSSSTLGLKEMLSLGRTAWLGLVAALFAMPCLAAHTLSPTHRAVLDSWLRNHPNLRVALPSDCCYCADDIAKMRRGTDEVWRPVPDYDPYRAVGDFNGDGNIDFAVVLIDKTKTEEPFVLVNFNGPFTSTAKQPAFIEADLDLSNEGLFFGPPRPKPYRLIVGAFESDNSGLLEPNGDSYRWSTEED
jgi:hypothetical protein